MKISDILSFSKEKYFNGAIQAEWFYDPQLSFAIGSGYVFHGPRYYGVSDRDVRAGEHKLMDTISFTSMISDRIVGRNNNGFVMTIAGYGTGKSHLAVTLGKLFSGDDARTREAIFNNICDVEPRLGRNLRRDVEPTRNLVIILNGMNNFNLDHEVLKCAKLALTQHGIDPAAMKELTTAYATAQHFLQQSFAMLQDRYAFYSEKVGFRCENSGALNQRLMSSLENDPTAFSIINSVYRELNGQDIQWDSGISAGDVLTFLSRRFVEEKHIFNRVLVLFDEFGRYIEYAAQNPGIAGDSALQQIFEAVQNAHGNIIHVAFIQSELSAYLSRIQAGSNINRYVGRYDTSDKYYLSSNFETILANLIIKKDEALFRQYIVGVLNRNCSHYSRIMMALNRWVKTSSSKGVWSNEEMFMNVICKGCYPLHPITVWMLANLSNWMQQRSTITFASEMFEEISDRYISTNSDFLPVIRPADIIESPVFNEMLNSEEKSLVSSQYCLLYREITTKLGDRLSNDERTVLNAVLIANIGRFEASNQEDAILAVRYCACLPEQTVRRCLASLENTHGVVKYSDSLRRYAMYAEANGKSDYTRIFLRYLIGANDKTSIEYIDETISEGWKLHQDIETAFARQHSISGYEWRFTKQLIPLDEFASAAGLSLARINSACDGDQARGLLMLLYTNHDIQTVENTVVDTYRKNGFGTKPVVVMVLSDPQKKIPEKLREYFALKALPESEKQRFSRFVEADKAATMTNLIQTFEEMLSKRILVSGNGVSSSTKRLNQICQEKLEACFSKAMPFNFDGFEKRLTPSIRRYYNETASNLANGVLRHRGSYDLLPSDVKNRMRGLFSDSVLRSWKMLDENLFYHMSTDERIADFFVTAKTEMEDEQSHSLNELFSRYLLAPYGMNQYSLFMLIMAFLSFYEGSVSVYSGSERLSLPQFVQAAFSGNKLQFASIMKLYARTISEDSLNGITQLCTTIIANRQVENCQNLSNRLEQMVQANDVPTAMKGNIASARLRIKEGLKLNKEIYSKLKDAQASVAELKTKFSFIKAANVYLKLEKYTGEIDDGSGYYFSGDYIKACEECLQMTRVALNELGEKTVSKLQCDITKLSQFKATYKRIVDVLRRNGFPGLANAIEVKIAQIESELVLSQKYRNSVDDVNYFLSTTKVNTTTTRTECLKAENDAQTWTLYWNSATDYPTEKRDAILAKLANLMDACRRKTDDADALYVALCSDETNITSETVLSQMRKKIAKLEAFGMTDQQGTVVSRISSAIQSYETFWEGRNLSRRGYVETVAAAEQLFSSTPYKLLVQMRLEKMDQQIRKEAKTWMQTNVLSYNRKIRNMPIHDALQLQKLLEKLPDCLDEDDLDVINNYREMLRERISLGRIEAITLMFKDLNPTEKAQCLKELQQIMAKSISSHGLLR